MRYTIGIAVSLLLCVATAEVGASPILNIDIGPGPLQTGYIPWDVGAQGNDRSSPQTLLLPDPFQTGRDLTITLIATPAPFDGVRDRFDLANPQSDLVRDFIFIDDDGDSMTLAFSNLPAGRFSLTTLSHDHCCAERGDANVFLTDAQVTNFPVGIADGTGAGDPASLWAFQVEFVSNGIDDVSVEYALNTSPFPLNGFSLQLVHTPEPSTLMLSGIVGLGAIGYSVWRRTRSNRASATV